MSTELESHELTEFVEFLEYKRKSQLLIRDFRRYQNEKQSLQAISNPISSGINEPNSEESTSLPSSLANNSKGLHEDLLQPDVHDEQTDQLEDTYRIAHFMLVKHNIFLERHKESEGASVDSNNSIESVKLLRQRISELHKRYDSSKSCLQAKLDMFHESANKQNVHSDNPHLRSALHHINLANQSLHQLQSNNPELLSPSFQSLLKDITITFEKFLELCDSSLHESDHQRKTLPPEKPNNKRKSSSHVEEPASKRRGLHDTLLNDTDSSATLESAGVPLPDTGPPSAPEIPESKFVELEAPNLTDRCFSTPLESFENPLNPALINKKSKSV